MRARDDVVQGNAFDGFAHQFPDAFGQRAVENQIGVALAVKPLTIERGCGKSRPRYLSERTGMTRFAN